MSHVAHLHTAGLRHLGSLQLHDLCRLRDEMNVLWKQGQATFSNEVYDKVVDGIAYELGQLISDPYEYVNKREENALKLMMDYLNEVYGQGNPLVSNEIWQLIKRELSLRASLPSSDSIVSPGHWTRMTLTESPVRLISLSQSSDEFKDLCSFFSQSLGQSSTVIYSIVRIENLRLWSMFQSVQSMIPNKTITRLIHGTASSVHQKLVLNHGFVQSFCPGGLIGDGIYLAVKASYSNCDPFVLKRTAHRRELFICQVLLGQSVQGKGGMKSPPVGSHSVFDHQQNNEMFCIFNPYQAYPQYLIQYDYK